MEGSSTMMHDEFSRARTLERMANDLISTGSAKHNALMPLSDNAVCRIYVAHRS